MIDDGKTHFWTETPCPKCGVLLACDGARMWCVTEACGHVELLPITRFKTSTDGTVTAA